jgi:hypothetical protein
VARNRLDVGHELGGALARRGAAYAAVEGDPQAAVPALVGADDQLAIGGVIDDAAVEPGPVPRGEGVV